MKKLTTILAALVLLLSTSAFTVTDVNVSARIIQEFQNDFGTVTDVKWKIIDEVYVVTFKENGKEAAASYDQEGELLASAKYIKSTELPIRIWNAVNNKYTDWAVEQPVIEVNRGETSYLMNLENDKFKITLEANSTGLLTVVSKTKK
jgi:hypothetical protein